MLGIAGRKRLVSRLLLLKVAGDQLADRVEHQPHELVLRGSFRPLVLPRAIVVPSACNLVHASGHRNNQTFTMTVARADLIGQVHAMFSASSGSVAELRKCSETMP